MPSSYIKLLRVGKALTVLDDEYRERLNAVAA
jgi:hypothetical protein